MHKVNSLVASWEQEADTIKVAAETKKSKASIPRNIPGVIDDDEGIFDNEVEPQQSTAALFDESEVEDELEDRKNPTKSVQKGIREAGSKEKMQKTPAETEKTLFGDSSEEESDEELVPESLKRGADESGGHADDSYTSKKRRVVEEEE